MAEDYARHALSATECVIAPGAMAAQPVARWRMGERSGHSWLSGQVVQPSLARPKRAADSTPALDVGGAD
jgi:hypothetical protein